MSKAKQRETLEKIIRAYEAAPALGNSVAEMIARTEYTLAKRMLSMSGPVPLFSHPSDADTKVAVVAAARKGEGPWDNFFLSGPPVSDDFQK